MGRRVLRLIGYWHGPLAEAGWPDVRDFVVSNPDVQQQEAVAAYLRSGTTFVAAAGFSLCRICGAGNGSTELTDGEHFVWPEGLAHYVEAHGVCLPNDVITVATQGPARTVDPIEFERALFETGDVTTDDGRWWRGLRRS